MSKIVRVIAAGLILSVGAAILIFAISRNSAGQKDFVEYWAAGKQLLNHANPYDAVAILRWERSAGYSENRALVSFSPPSSLVWTLPLGLIPAKLGLIIWLLLLMACLMISIRMIWIMNGRPASRTHLLGYLFAPVFACLIAGQLGIFLLFAFTSFLYLNESRPFVAGLLLLPCTLKPHLFLPLAVVLLVWVLLRRRFWILTGVGVANIASVALTAAIDPGVLSQYRDAMKSMDPVGLFVPTWSMLLRLSVHRDASWLQFLPEAVACLWGLWYFWSRRDKWNWREHGLLLSLISLLCAPYAWFSDEALLLPAVLAACFYAEESDRSLAPFGVIAGVALIEVFTHVPITSPYYMWTVPAWLGWYLFTSPFRRKLGAAECMPYLDSGDVA